MGKLKLVTYMLLIITLLSISTLTLYKYGYLAINTNNSPSAINYDSYQFMHDPATIKHLNEVRPGLKEKILPILAKLEDMGYQPRIVQGLRTMAAQRDAIRRGASETLHSKHLIGAAVDIVDKRYGWGGPASNLSFQFWQDYGKLVDGTPGLVWGGDWGQGYDRYLSYIHHKTHYFVDVAHAQLSQDEIEKSQLEWDNRNE